MSDDNTVVKVAPPDRAGAVPPVFFAIIFCAGISFSILGSTIPDISDRFSLDTNQASWLVLAQFSGDFLGLAVLGFLLNRQKLLFASSSILLGASALAVAALPGYTLVMSSAFLVFGAASGVMIALPGMVAASSAGRDSAGAMNVLYAFFSAGVMTAPAVSGVIVETGLSYRGAYVALGVLSLATAALYLASRPGEVGLGKGLGPGAVADLFRGHRRIVLAVILMNLFYVGAEAVPNAWIPKYLDDTYEGYSKLRSALVLSFFWAAMTGGRFVCAWAIKRGLSARPLLAALAGSAAVLLALAPFMPGRPAAEALFVASGLAFSGMFPLIISNTARLPEGSSSTLFILVMAAGMVGASAAGRSVGALAELVGFGNGMLIAAGMSLAVLAMVPLLRPGAGEEE